MMKLRLNFLFTNHFQHFGIDLVVFGLKYFIRGQKVTRRIVNFVVKLKVIQSQPKYKTRYFKNLIKNRLLIDSQSATWSDYI